jgi:seryl-tRNA synthetase
VTEKISQTETEERERMIESMRTLKSTLQEKESKLEEVMKRWRLLMLQVPNIPDMSVPEGENEDGNQEVKTWKEAPNFSFTPKSHIELMNNLDMIDFERGVKVAGFRGYFLKNDAVLLSFSLWRFALDILAKRGFSPAMTPSVVRKEIFLGTGYLPQGEDDLYKTQDDSYLIGTSEVPLMGHYLDEVLSYKDLPKKFAGFSPCFRREAGSHGKDTKGAIRVHEFFKIEQVVLCEASHETSVRMHEEITMNAEEIMQALEIPYRMVINCGADLGLGQVKKYDIEGWVPSEGKFRETHSSSYFHDFQTRRMNIKYRDQEGKVRFAHSLNNTALATPRLLVSLVENHQEEDGSIVIPKALRPYFGKEKIIPVSQQSSPNI